MACQLRFSTSTVAFVNMFIKLQTTTAPGRSGVCSLLRSARIKLAARAGFAPTWPPSKGGVLLIRRPGKKVVEPEVVATSPYPIKSRVPVCCGFSSINWWAREDLHLQGSQILDLWGLLFPLNHSPGNWCSQSESHRQPQPSEGCALIIELQEQKMEPPAGAAPRHDLLTKKACRLLRRGKEMVGRHGSTASCSAV